MNLDSMSTAALALIREDVRETPLEESAVLSERAGCRVSLKLENFQVTGSFKIRGVLAKLRALPADELARGVITASTGNHGLACAHAAGLIGFDVEIVLPEGAPEWRREALRRAGAGVVLRGGECEEAEVWARAEAGRRGLVYVPPYNDADVVAGQGTIGIELSRQADRVDLVCASVGGGGLLAGVAGALKGRHGEARALGCLPSNSPAMHDSIAAGRIVRSEVLPTLSDATAGNIEEGAITFDLCRRHVDDWVLVSEDEIRSAMELVLRGHDMMIEGAAGVAVAGFLKHIPKCGLNRDSHAVIIVCGGNVSPAELAGFVLPTE
ncbi:MAG: pyridoxal-phosphate dependent enzyme [Candidatus Eisenbacteria bacterium]